MLKSLDIITKQKQNMVYEDISFLKKSVKILAVSNGLLALALILHIIFS